MSKNNDYPYSYFADDTGVYWSSTNKDSFISNDQYECLDSTFTVMDVHFLYYNSLFEKINFPEEYETLKSTLIAATATASKSRIKVNNNPLIDNVCTQLFNKIEQEYLFPNLIKGKFPKSEALLDSNEIEQSSELSLNQYRKMVVHLFSEFIEYAPSLEKYLPYLLTCFLLNNRPPYQDNINTIDFSIKDINELDVATRNKFFERLLHYKNPVSSFRYLEEYQNICNAFYFPSTSTAKHLSSESFINFWKNHYYLIYFFSICTDICKQNFGSNCNYNLSFLLFFNDLYSIEKNLVFNEFLPLFTVFFFPSITTSYYKFYECDVIEDTQRTLFSQIIYFKEPDSIFSHISMHPWTPLADDSIAKGYIFTLLANYSHAEQKNAKSYFHNTKSNIKREQSPWKKYLRDWQNTKFILFCYERILFPYITEEHPELQEDTIFHNLSRGPSFLPKEEKIIISQQQIEDTFKECNNLIWGVSNSRKERTPKSDNLWAFILERYNLFRNLH